jgi:hypothetical protein
MADKDSHDSPASKLVTIDGAGAETSNDAPGAPSRVPENLGHYQIVGRLVPAEWESS